MPEHELVDYFRRPIALVILGIALVASGCGEISQGAGGDATGQLNVVTTTTMIRDAVEHVGGEHVNAQALMGPGVDPHSYRARESDVVRMTEADIIFYNGLHLEGAMSDVLERAGNQIPTVAVAEQIDEEALIPPDEDTLGQSFEGQFDPHIWFDVELWKLAVEVIRDKLTEVDPENEGAYRDNTERYLAELDHLDQYIRDRIAELPEHQRVLITAHDAFGYLGDTYGLDVLGLQPLSTSVEAGTADVSNLAEFIAEREIRAIFLETAVPPQGIEAVREAVEARGFDVVIGGELYGDALGEPGSEEGTYIGAYRRNIDTIVNALLGEDQQATVGSKP